MRIVNNSIPLKKFVHLNTTDEAQSRTVIYMPQTVMKFIAKRRPMCDNSK